MEPLEIDGCDALILKPADFDPAQRYPVLVSTYGGPGAQMTQNAWGRSTFLFHALLTQKGYIVFSLDNRGSAGKGQMWEAELLKRFGQKELEGRFKPLQKRSSCGNAVSGSAARISSLARNTVSRIANGAAARGPV